MLTLCSNGERQQPSKIDSILNLDSYKAVFFDAGGTLLSVYPSVGEVYANHARPFGFQGTGYDLDRQFRRTWNEVGGLESLGRQSGSEIDVWCSGTISNFNFITR